MPKRNGKIQGFNSAKVGVIGHYSKMNMSLSTRYSDIYKEGVAKGYDVPHVRLYHVNPDNNAKGYDDIEMYIKTPYFAEGKPVWGHMVVTNSGSKLENGLRTYNTGEFWSDRPDAEGAQNLQDMYHIDYQLQDKDGNEVDYHAALDEMGVFASAASEYPSVCTYDEYVKLKNESNARLNLAPPTESDYNKYLDHCANMMKSGCTYIGEVRTVDDMHIRYVDTPSFMAEMQEQNERGMEEFFQNLESNGSEGLDGSEGPEGLE